MAKTLDNIVKNPPARVAVIGAAKSGIAAAKYFCGRGSRVFISDTCSREKLDTVLRENNLVNEFIESEANSHSEKILECDLIILSPGVRSDLEILKSAREKNISVWSEMELGYNVSSAEFLAVTGSSGKSTTVSLLNAAMNGAGCKSVLAGNIGVPVIDVVPKLSEDDFVVAEVSSFQLETIENFKPKVAAVLNLMKNHLDRYDSEDDYYNAKKRIAENLTQDDYLVLNYDDERLLSWARKFLLKTRVVMFAANENVCQDFDNCVYLRGNAIVYSFNGRGGVILNDVSRMKIGGRHNHINACAAAAVALCAGANVARIGKGLCEFAGLAHRLEFVADINGVEFYNDSKSTTAESIECAVNAFDSKVNLIAGGKDKGCDFSAITDAIKANAKSVTLIGEAKERMASEWENIVPVRKVATLEEAVCVAFENSSAGEKVIFSPGCSSFDMFKNFEHRGVVFKEIVNEIALKKRAS